MSKFIRTLIVSSLVGVFVFVYVIYGETGDFPNMAKHFENLLFVLILCGFTGFLMGYISDKFNDIFPWGKKLTIRLLLGFLANVFLVALVCLPLLGLYVSLLDNQPAFFDLFKNYQEPVLKLIIIGLAVVFVYSIMDFTLFSYGQFAKQQINNIKTSGEQICLQFASLKSQLNPHYLFNSLNTISALVESDPEVAENFIRKLAKTYQYILKNEDRSLVSLSSELEFVNAYNYLLQVRFDRALKFDIQVEDAWLDYKLPPLSVQMLVENCVKHNGLTEENPLLVEIFVRDDRILVRNNLISKSYFESVNNTLVKRKDKEASFKVGLDNIRERYKPYTRQEMKICKDTHYTVSLPLLKPELKAIKGEKP